MHIQLYLNHSEIACHCGFSTHSEKEVFLSQQTRQVPATYLRRHIAVLSMQQFCSAYSHQLPSVSSEPELEAPLEPIAKLSLQDAARKILRDSEYLCRFHVDSHSILLPRHNSSGERNRECVQLGASSLDLHSPCRRNHFSLVHMICTLIAPSTACLFADCEQHAM
jgi:hypothetical protein